MFEGWESQVSVVARIAFAMLLGGLIGLEREIKDRPAGFRTHTLVAAAAAMLTGWIWSRQTARVRSHLRPGLEWLAFVPILIGTVALFWNLGPSLRPSRERRSVDDQLAGQAAQGELRHHRSRAQY